MPTALLSTYDKTGLIEFAQGLSDIGYTLLASGGTAKALRANGIFVTEVSEYTKSPEILGGRVKTLHPAIHGGILARESAADLEEITKQGWEYINLVAVNLYPFEKTIQNSSSSFEEAIEQIDIGGVALIRAAAKNHTRVILACDPSDYAVILKEIQSNSLTEERRKGLAIKGFALTAKYDLAIAEYLSAQKSLTIHTYLERTLRYGENPHQTAELYTFTPNKGPLGGELLQGKELSYNNLLDLDAAWRAVVSFQEPTICIVKHLSPCGIASNTSLDTAFKDALASDPVSAFGGIVASNQLFDNQTAKELKNLFVECIIAPGFSEEALKTLSTKKKCRLIEMPDLSINPRFEIRSINEGLLKQEIDFADPAGTEFRVVTKRTHSSDEWTSLKFAWKACQFVKSNAVLLAKNQATVGIGGGQPNRVDCVRMAIERASDKARESVMASDAFFPFPDSVEIARQSGITAIIQPGGSIRDAESIEAADKAGIAMVFTGVRHFRH